MATKTIVLFVCNIIVSASTKELIGVGTGRKSNTVTVKYEGSLEEAKAFGSRLGLQFKTKAFGDWYVFTIPTINLLVPKDVPDIHINLKKTKKLDGKVKFIEQESYRRRVKASLTINDEEWPNQWHLQPSQTPSMNVYKAWEMGYNGSGITVAIVDTGLDVKHPDLIQNYNSSLSYDYIADTPDASDKNNDGHGTFCAGVVAATKDENCVIGIAYESTLAAIRSLPGGDEGDEIEENGLSWASLEAMSLTHKYQYIDIYSNSWTPNDEGDIYPLDQIVIEAFELTIKEGRNGKGTIYTFASGNGGPDYSCSVDPYSGSAYTISIAALNQAGSPISYGEQCTAILAATYSGDDNLPYITTTGLNDTCVDNFDGTSAACPQASGIIALTLQANPELTWRDIQHMIVEFSNQSGIHYPISDVEVYTNGAGKKVSIVTGFGLMDALAMVKNAPTWSTVPPRISCGSGDLHIDRSETNADTFDVFFTVKNCLIKYIEHIRIFIDYKSSYNGYVEFYLLSPMGTRSRIMPSRPLDNNTDYLSFMFLSVHTWGEDPSGEWTLTMYPIYSDLDVHLWAWGLDIYGAATDPLVGVPAAGTFGSPCNSTASCSSVEDGGCLKDDEVLIDSICIPCKNGYHFSGDFCEKDCPPLFSVGNGYVVLTPTNEGTIAKYSCVQGYAISDGDLTRTCGSDGFWTGFEPTCEIDCGPLDAQANGNVSFSGTTYDYDAVYNCYEGFDISEGDEQRICSENGSWTGIKPTCKRTCRIPESPNDGYVSFPDTFVSSEATFTCNEGYVLTGGNAKIVCGSDGNWSSVEPLCLIDCCSLEPPTNGIINFTSTTHGSNATYTCLTGFAVSSGNSSRTCAPDGKWTGTAPVCDIDCGPLDSPVNGTVSVSSTTKGSTVTYACLSGFTVKSGSMFRSCSSDGFWTGTKLTCGTACRIPGSPNDGNVSYFDTFEGSEATFTCTEGYVLTGNAKIVCGSDGIWSSIEPRCLIDCGSLEPPTNGIVNLTSTTDRSIATYSCSTGFAVSSGSSSRTCSYDGKWTGTAPVCDKDCGPLDSPENGYVSLPSTTRGSIATYACLSGFTVKSGSVLRVCSSDGFWTGTKLTCRADEGDTASAVSNDNMEFIIMTCVGLLAIVYVVL